MPWMRFCPSEGKESSKTKKTRVAAVTLDHNTFYRVRARALAQGTSFNEQVRQLCRLAFKQLDWVSPGEVHMWLTPSYMLPDINIVVIGIDDDVPKMMKRDGEGRWCLCQRDGWPITSLGEGSVVFCDAPVRWTHMPLLTMPANACSTLSY